MYKCSKRDCHFDNWQNSPSLFPTSVDRTKQPRLPIQPLARAAYESLKLTKLNSR
jgi:hypothetical protein